MANIYGKVASWAAREAEEYAAKHSVSIQKAIETIEEKYGQRIYKKTASPVFTPEEKSILSSEKGKRVYYPPQEGPLPRKGDNRSLTEIQGEQRAQVLPGVFESMGARESSKYAEGLSARQRTVPAVEQSISAREASKFQDPAVRLDERLRQQSADQKGRIRSRVDESATAREASKYNEPDLPQYSKPIGPEQDFTRGMDSTYKESSGNLRSALAAGAAGGTALAGGMYLRDSQKSNEQGGQAASEEEERLKQKWRDSWTRSQIPFTEEDIERKWKSTVESKPSPQQIAEQRAIQAETGAAKRQEDLERLRERQRMAGIPESQLSTALRKATPEELAAEQEARIFRTQQAGAANQPEQPPSKPSLDTKPTPEVKKEVKKAVAATDTTAKEAQKAADKGEIPQSVADSYKTQRDEAYRRYDEAKERNEWLELAQLLGQAATQFGAAQIGMRTGRSMAGLQIPGVDYGARTEREAKLLQTRLGDIEEQQKAEQKEKELEQDRQYRTLKLALDRQELEDRKAERAGRMSAEERLEKTTLRDSINKDLAAAQKQYQAALTFANQAAMEKDLSPKSLKKIEEKAPGLLAQAGIQPAELQQIEKEATDKGWIWDTVDPKKKQQLIQERILDKQTNIIQGLKAQLGQLAGRSAGQTPPPSGTVKIQAPDGTIAEVPADKAQKYIDKGGKIVQ